MRASDRLGTGRLLLVGGRDEGREQSATSERTVPLYRQLGSVDYGGGHPEPTWKQEVQSVQRRKSACWVRASSRPTNASQCALRCIERAVQAVG